MITQSKFKYPQIRYETIQPLNKGTIQAGDELSRTLGPLLQQALSRARPEYSDTLDVLPSQYTTGGAAGLERSLSGLRDIEETGAPVDTRSIFSAMQSDALRNLREYVTPDIAERFGVRGGAYGSDIANAIARASGDILGKVGIAGATAEVGAQESARGRRLGAAGEAGWGNVALANIGSILQALQESNIGRRYTEFLRRSQAPGSEYFGAAQNLVNTPAKFPQIVTGGAPAFEPGISWLDMINTVSNVARSAASAYGAAGCWIAAELYGYGSPEFHLARRWIFDLWEGPVAQEVRKFYLEYGKEIAEAIRRDGRLRDLIKPLFDYAIELAKSEVEVYA